MERKSLFFPKDYLLLETEKFAISVKYFFEKGTLSKDEYEYVSITLKMIKTFLNTHIQTSLSLHRTWDDYSKPLHRYRKQQKHYPRQPSLFDFSNPIPITVIGLNERLDALKPKEPKSTEPKFPHKIPSGTHWKQVIINFLNNEQIEINVKKLKYITDYKEMGFVGKGNIPSPSEQWIFLKVLAQCNGEITIKDETAKDTYKQQKHLLTESLQNYFSIDFDPFYPYKSSPEKHGNSYRIKLTLIPPPKQYNEPHIEPAEEDTLGIREFLDEHAPQVIES